MMKLCTFFLRTLPFIIFTFTIFITIHSVQAQGGPPMITDDSDTPGDGNWENNFAIGFEGSRNNYQVSFPDMDLNYGLGEHIQLKCEIPWVKQSGESLANKFDHITLGLKYHFLDEDSDGVSVSVYPQPIISLNPEDHSKKIEYGIFLPFAISKQFFKTGFNFQAGYQILGAEKQIVYGLVVDRELGKYFQLLIELHSTLGREANIGPNGEDEIFFRAGTFLNLGLQIKPDKKYFINLAIGKDIESSPTPSEEAKYYGYLGLQLNL